MKKTFILAVVLFLVKVATAQDTKSYSDKEFSLIIGPSLTNVKNDNLESDKYASSKGSVWFNLGIGFCKYFNKNFGFITGIEYSRYSNVTSYRGAYRSDNKSVDKDGYLYYAVSEADYKETRNIHTAEVPLGLRLQVPLNDKAQFFIDFGIRMNFIGSAKVIRNGTLNKKGAYPNNTFDNVFLYIEDDAYLGFTNSSYYSTIDIPVNRINIGYFIGGGVKARLSENKFLLVYPTYINGITDLVKKDSASEYVNIFGEKTPYKKYTLNQIALRIGIVFEI